MPNANILFEKCSQINIRNISQIVQFMYEDGYFHNGVEKLSDEHANRNYDKAIRWIEKGIIPQFLLDDMNEYIKSKTQINNKETLRIESC